MARLPQPGGDSGNWGSILNDYLMQAHKADGTLKDDSVTTNAIADSSITETLLAPAVQTKLNSSVADWAALTNKPAVIAAGADAAAARTAIDVLSEQQSNTAYAKIGDGLVSGSVILFGTSLEAQNASGADAIDPAPGTFLTGRGWYHWANAYLGNSLKLIRNSGIGGNTYTQMLARVDADVLAYKSDWVFMGGPTNDTSTGRTTAEIIADATAILDKLNDRRVLLLTAPPTSAHAGSEINVLFEVNAWIRQLPKTRRNIIVVDIWNALAAAGSVTPTTGMTIDGIHYALNGAARIGKLVADAIKPLLPNTPHSTSNAIDPTSIISNPTFDSSGSGWVVQGTGVSAAYSTADDAFVNKAVLTFTGVSSTGNLGIQYEENISGGRFAAGNQIRVSARIRWSGTAPLSVASQWGPMVLVQRVQTDNTIYGGDQTWGFVPSSEWQIPSGVPSSGVAIVTTSILTIPSSASPINRLRIRVGFRGIASGTIEITDVAACKI